MRNVIIALDRGHNETGSWAEGVGGLREVDVIRGVADALEGELTRYPALRDGIIGLPREYPIEKRFRPVTESFAGDRETVVVMVSIHANAGGGRGTAVFYPPRAPERTADTHVLAEAIVAGAVKTALAFDASWRRYSGGAVEALPVPWPNLRLVRVEAAAAGGMLETDFNTRFYPVLVETGFVDHPRDAAWLGRADFQAAMGLAIAAAVVSFVTKMGYIEDAPAL
jgi:N-acetylmuramoyl-L-alanine amidase